MRNQYRKDDNDQEQQHQEAPNPNQLDLSQSEAFFLAAQHFRQRPSGSLNNFERNVGTSTEPTAFY